MLRRFILLLAVLSLSAAHLTSHADDSTHGTTTPASENTPSVFGTLIDVITSGKAVDTREDILKSDNKPDTSPGNPFGTLIDAITSGKAVDTREDILKYDGPESQLPNQPQRPHLPP